MKNDSKTGKMITKWNHVPTFEQFFDNKLIDFIAQMINAYAIETNAVGWVRVGRSDICCFLGILMLSGYVQLPSYKMFWEEASDVQP